MDEIEHHQINYRAALLTWGAWIEASIRESSPDPKKGSLQGRMFHGRKAAANALLSSLAAAPTRGAKKSAAKLPVVLLQANFV